VDSIVDDFSFSVKMLPCLC